MKRSSAGASSATVEVSTSSLASAKTWPTVGWTPITLKKSPSIRSTRAWFVSMLTGRLAQAVITPDSSFCRS